MVEKKNLKFDCSEWSLQFIEEPFKLFKLRDVFADPKHVEKLKKEVDCLSFSHKNPSSLQELVNDEFVEEKYKELIVESIEQNGVIMMQNFLKSSFFEAISDELDSSSVLWIPQGPSNRKKYEIADLKKLPPKTKNLITYFQSNFMCSYLESISGLKFYKKITGREYVHLMIMEIQSWRRGCYSIMTHDDSNLMSASLDVLLFFNVANDSVESVGKNTSNVAGNIYYCEKESVAVCRVDISIYTPDTSNKDKHACQNGMYELFKYFPLYKNVILIQNIFFLAYKFCVSESDSVSQKCQAILKGNSQVSCVPVIDSADCAIKLIDKKADFGVFSAEDAFFVANQINDKVNVIGELRNIERWNETYAFQTAVVVRNNHNGGFGGLRSTNYCHPGFGDGQFWTDRVLKEFESIVVPRICNSNKSTTESEIASLSDFFKSACRPGQWAYDALLDKKLKKKYSSLCALCDSPGRCSYNENYKGSQKETLSCLTKIDGGDVAYVALEDVQEYFGLLPNARPAKANSTDYKFLCTDKSYQPLKNPCTWINQRWPVVVALKEKAVALKSSIVNDFLCKRNDCRGKWQEAFTLLFEKTDQVFTPVSSKDDNLLKFVNEARTIPTDREEDPCKDKSVRLCTVNSAEFAKCSWLKQAVISEGIEPKLNCIEGYNMWSCFDRIMKSQADIIGIDTDFTFIAKNSFNLSAVIYQDSNNNDAFFLIVPIIKANSNIKSLADFKNKRISFPEFDGLAWNAFVAVTKAYSVLPKKCPYFNAVSSFVKSACAPGVYDLNHKYFNSTVPENICSLCAKMTNNSSGECPANSSNKYFGDLGALRLLLDDESDVAVVDYRRLFTKENVFRTPFNTSLYRILCKDGKVKPLGSYAEIETECALSFGVAAEIISRSSIRKSERRDITELLLKMDDRFGARLSSWDNPIMMYRPFNGTAGLIFKYLAFRVGSPESQNPIRNQSNKAIQSDPSNTLNCFPEILIKSI
ncbi:hypothetical protein V9T40_014510 [Parthenolecanium corni]|uniref:Transferrin-like domain-containing protein n=1 Tax=Parthenolecanium corni TaxID=536013 RepID=A0AAN9XXF1_9HEMI